MLPKYIKCYQFDIRSGDVPANLSKVRAAITEENPEPGGLLLLPELWSAGFNYDNFDRQAEETTPLLEELIFLARKYDVLIAGSLPEKKMVRGSVHYFNTLFFAGPGGIIGKYRKQHPFPPLAEDRYFTAGDRPDPVTTETGSIGALVCFDIRFPELARYQVRKGAQLLVVSGQWPATRQKHWQTILQARAIENQVYIAACNRCGESGGTLYRGGSLILAPDGSILEEAGEGETWIGCDLEPRVMQKARSLFVTAGIFPYPVYARDKIISLDELSEKVRLIRQNKSRLVFTNGCFDILHEGHVTYLEKARKEGDCLIVGLNSDASIRAIKGPGRPINGEASRARVLAGLECVDYVILFEEETPLELINTLLPDVLIKGGDWSPENIVGAVEVEAAGGRVKNVEMVAGFSTSCIVEKIAGSTDKDQ